MYSGYHCNVMVNKIFAYGADGKVFLGELNILGSWCVGSFSSNLFPSIRKKIGWYKICVDQKFLWSGDAYDVLVGPISKRSASWQSPILHPYLLRLSNTYTLLRQASEWGMICLQGWYPRFKRGLPNNMIKRKCLIQSIVLITTSKDMCLDAIKSKQFLVKNMMEWSIFMVTTELATITIKNYSCILW